MKKNLLIAFLCVLGMAGLANATAVQWSVNGHWYDVITTSSTLSWEQARDAAAANNWHLVTITSLEEDRFVASLLGSQKTTNAENYWLGGYQTVGAVEPLGGWTWVTGEAWTYSNWYVNEPNNGVGGTQNYLHYWPEGTWQWDDMDNRNTMVGYVVEQNPVPEPATMFLLGTGLVGLAGVRNRRKK